MPTAHGRWRRPNMVVCLRSLNCWRLERPRLRPSWSRRSRRTVSAATRAATPARSPTAPSASARCASTAAAGCTCRGATSAACSAIRSRRSRSSTRIRARSPTASACSAAICIAATARTGSPRRRCAIRSAVSPPLDVAPAALVRDALRHGARVVVSTYNEPLITSEWAVAIFKEARAAGLLTGYRLERQRHAAGARLHPALDRPLQGRSQELRRSRTTASWAAGSRRSSTPSAACTRWASGSRS